MFLEQRFLRSVVQNRLSGNIGVFERLMYRALFLTTISNHIHIMSIHRQPKYAILAIIRNVKIFKFLFQVLQYSVKIENACNNSSPSQIKLRKISSYLQYHHFGDLCRQLSAIFFREHCHSLILSPNKIDIIS
jgi:hypothetical protein